MDTLFRVLQALRQPDNRLQLGCQGVGQAGTLQLHAGAQQDTSADPSTTCTGHNPRGLPAPMHVTAHELGSLGPLQGTPAAPQRTGQQQRLYSRPTAALAGCPRRRRLATAAAAASDAWEAEEGSLVAATESYTADSASSWHVAAGAEVRSGSGVFVALCGCNAALSSPPRSFPPLPCSPLRQQKQHAFLAADPQPVALMNSSASLLGGSRAGPFGPTEPLGGAGGSGWVWAAAVLLAARMGRVAAQEARLDVRQLQVGWIGGGWSRAGA